MGLRCINLFIGPTATAATTPPDVSAHFHFVGAGVCAELGFVDESSEHVRARNPRDARVGRYSGIATGKAYISSLLMAQE